MGNFMEVPEYTFPLTLDLQTFARGGEGGSGTGGGGAGESGAVGSGGDAGKGGDEGSKKGDGSGEGKDKTFTQDDVNKIISDRLAKERSKWEKDFQAKIDEAKTEAEKLARMNAEPKAEYERKKQEEALTKREQEITRRELRATALETLAEKSMPKELADILNYTDADSTSKSIEAVEKVFRKAVEDGVNERLKGNPPKGGSGGNSAVPDADKIEKIFNQR